jgi:putative transposase
VRSRLSSKGCWEPNTLQEQKIVPTYGKHQGVKLLGTLDYASGKVFCMESEKYDAKVYLSFLEEVPKEYPNQRIALIQDNARIHHAKLLQPFYKANGHRLEIHFPPPYSPNLIRIEPFWGWLKKSCVYNVFYKSTQEIRSHVQEFIKNRLKPLIVYVSHLINLFIADHIVENLPFHFHSL